MRYSNDISKSTQQINTNNSIESTAISKIKEFLDTHNETKEKRHYKKRNLSEKISLKDCLIFSKNVKGNVVCFKNLKKRKLFDENCSGELTDETTLGSSKRTQLKLNPISDLVKQMENLVNVTENQTEDDRLVRQWKLLEKPSNYMMAARATSQWNPCKCDLEGHSNSSYIGWEGSAILHQGSLMKFGCLYFVFSITAYGQPYPTDV